MKLLLIIILVLTSGFTCGKGAYNITKVSSDKCDFKKINFSEIHFADYKLELDTKHSERSLVNLSECKPVYSYNLFGNKTNELLGNMYIHVAEKKCNLYLAVEFLTNDTKSIGEFKRTNDFQKIDYVKDLISSFSEKSVIINPKIEEKNFLESEIDQINEFCLK